MRRYNGLSYYSPLKKTKPNNQMKKIYLLLLLCLPVCVNAQTLSFSDLPSVGSGWIMGDDTLYSQTIPSGGTGQIWDYSSLINSFPDTMGFISVTGTPYSTSFPTSNLAGLDLSTTTYSYFTANNTGLYLDGIANSTNAFAFSPSRLYFPVPFAYGNTRNTFSRIQIDTIYQGNNVRVISRTNSIFEADGTGTLILPSGTFSNVLRIKETALTYDSILVNVAGFYVPVSNAASQISSFNFLHPGNSVVLIMSLDGDSLGTMANKSRYYTGVSVNGIETSGNRNEKNIFPNPANDFINLNISQINNAATVDIYSTKGQLVKTCSLKEIENGIISTNGLKNGNYIYSVKMGAKLITGSFIVQH